MRLRVRSARLAVVLVSGSVVLAAAAASADESTRDTERSHRDDTRVATSTVAYQAPAVTLLRADGTSVSLPQELDDGRPVLLNFIFTTCSSICPLTSQTFAEFQRKLGPEAPKVHLMSISIDPEQDTPARLAEYARKFHAGPGWQYYTGTLAASIATQRAFDVYRGEKMSHAPVTLMRASPGQPWLRIEGFATPDELVHDYRRLLASR
jgi:protein SCO1